MGRKPKVLVLYDRARHESSLPKWRTLLRTTVRQMSFEDDLFKVGYNVKK